jgi:CHASE3 domain sensor protein
VRASVSLKVIAALAVVLALSAVAVLMVYRGLSRVAQEMRHLADVREPSYTATNKIEINLNGMAHAVFAYLRNPEPQSRTKLGEDEADVASFLNRYLELSTGEPELELARRLDSMFQEFRVLADTMMERRDRQEAALTRVATNLERSDATIDRMLHLTPNSPETVPKLAALSDLESELAEVAFGLVNYQRARDPRFKSSVAANAAEFRAVLARLPTLALTPR